VDGIIVSSNQRSTAAIRRRARSVQQRLPDARLPTLSQEASPREPRAGYYAFTLDGRPTLNSQT
jgi:hypothetical protein